MILKTKVQTTDKVSDDPRKCPSCSDCFRRRGSELYSTSTVALLQLGSLQKSKNAKRKEKM